MEAKSARYVVVEKDSSGVVRQYPLTDKKLVLQTKQGAQYTLIDTTTNKSPTDLLVKRKGQSLAVEQQGVETVELLEYYDDAAAIFQLDGSLDPSIVAQETLTPATEAIGTLSTGEPVIWATESSKKLLLPLFATDGSLFAFAGIIAAGAVAVSNNSGAKGDDATNQTTSIDGSLQDDYIAFAQVFADLNNNGVWDEGEPITTTDANGKFHLEGLTDPNVNLIAVGGVDTASGVPNNMVYKVNTSASSSVADGHDIVISPMSTMISAIAEVLKSNSNATTITPELLTQAAVVLANSLGMTLDDPSVLLNFDAVAQATGENRTDQDLNLLAVNRQLSVVISATGALVNGGSVDDSNKGTEVSAKAFADVLIAKNDAGELFSLTDANDVKSVVENTMTLSNTLGVTQDLRASTETDLKLLGTVISGFNTKIDAATKADDPMSVDAVAAMVAVNDLMIPLLQNSGSEASSERGGDISISGSLQGFVTAVGDNKESFITDKIRTQKDAIQNKTADFGNQQDVAGYINEYVPLAIQLPSLGIGDVVDTLTLDMRELAAQNPAVKLFRYDPLTKDYVEIPYQTAPESVSIEPKYAGFLFVKATAAVSPIANLFDSKVEILVKATNTVNLEETTYNGQLVLEIRERPVQVIASITSVEDNVSTVGSAPLSPVQQIANGGVTNDATPLIVGTLNQPLPQGDAGRYYRLEVYDGSNLLGEADVNDKYWTFTPSTSLEDGSHQFTARVTFREPDGDVITLNWASRPYTVTVDTIAPDAPFVEPSAGNVVTGTAEAGSLVTIKANDQVLGTATADENGRFSYKASTRIPQDTVLTAHATDPAGNIGPASTPRSVDWVAPTQLVTITSVTDDVAPVTGNVANGGFTNDNQLDVRGMLSSVLGPNETLKVYREGSDQPLGTATVTGTSWQFLTNTLANGEYKLYARVELDTGTGIKLGANASNHTVTVDTQVPVQTIIVDRAMDNVGTLQGRIGNQLNANDSDYKHTNDANPTFEGKLSATLGDHDALVVYSTRVVNNQNVTVKLGTATVDGTSWAFTPSFALPDATHTFTFQIEDKAGNVSATANKATYAFTVDTKSADNIEINSGSAVSIAESTQDVVYTASVAPSQTGRTVSWSLSEDSDPRFTINAQTGEVSVVGYTDFESNDTASFTVIAYDGVNAPTAKTVTATINNVIEAASIMSVTTDTLTNIATPAQGETVELTFTLLRSTSVGSASVSWDLGLPASDLAQLIAMSLPTSGVATFADGSDAVNVVVNVPASLTQEALRHAKLTIANPSTGYAIDPNNADAIIAVTDANAALASGERYAISATQNAMIHEGAEGKITSLTYTIHRTGGDSPVGYEITPSGAALISGIDFCDAQGNALTSLPSGVLTFNDQGIATLTIYVRGDNDVGPNEAFNFMLTGISDTAKVIGATSGMIINDDTYISVMAREIPNTTSGDVTHEFVVTRSGNSVGEHQVTYRIMPMGENATTQFNQEPKVLTFADGETQKVISFTTIGTEIINGIQSFGIQLDPADNITLLNHHAISTVKSNVQDIAMQAQIDRTLEGSNTEFSYTITRSGDTSQPLDIPWSVIVDPERGVSANDFIGSVLPSGVIRFAANQTEANIAFSSMQDSILEGDEGFRILLNDAQLPDYVRLITPSISGVIADDEAAVGFANNAQFSVVEGDNGTADLIVTVSRVGFTGRESSIDWALSFQTGEGKASLADLMQGQVTSGRVTFKPGEATANITIKVAGDTAFEAGLNESFSVTLANPSEGTKLIGGSGASGVAFAGYGNTTTAVITNDDALIFVATPTYSADEGNGGSSDYMEITVVRTGSTVGQDTVKWSLYTKPNQASADNADLGQDNSAVGVLDKYQNSWINLANFNGSQSASGSVEITKSGYIMVAYNRDWEFDDYDDGNQQFDQFLLKNLSVSNGATITSLGTVSNQNYVANDTAISGYGQVLFDDPEGKVLPNADRGGHQVVISGKEDLGSIYFKVTGLSNQGEVITEIVKGSNGGVSSTAAYFTKLTKIETLAPGFSVDELDVPTDDYDYSETDYFSKLQLTWNSGELPSVRSAVADEYWAGSNKHGAEYEGDMGYPVLRSEADLSDATFTIKGGLVVAYFDNTRSNGDVSYSFKEGDGDYGQDAIMRFDIPQKIRAEQVSGIFQSDDDSDAANYFMITGINAAGEKVSEVLAVEDFDVNGLAEVNAYTSGNLISQTAVLDTPARIMISTNGENEVIQTQVLTMDMLLSASGLTSANHINYLSLRDITSGKVERYDGQAWVALGSWNSINKNDVVQGFIRATGGMSGSFFGIEVQDNINWNNTYPKFELIQPTSFTVTGTDAEGRTISEVVSAPDYNFAVDSDGDREGDKATIATVKHFATVTSITANQAFSGNIQIGTSKPVETENAFIEVFGVAPVDADGNMISAQPKLFTMDMFIDALGEDVAQANSFVFNPQNSWFTDGSIQKNYGTNEEPNWQTLGYQFNPEMGDDEIVKFIVTDEEIEAGMLRYLGDYSRDVSAGTVTALGEDDITNYDLAMYGYQTTFIGENWISIDREVMEAGGRFEFTVPLEVTLQGPNMGVVVSPQVMNYIESIEVKRNLPENISVDIGIGNSAAYTGEPVVLSLNDILSLTQTSHQESDLYRVRIYGFGDAIEYNAGTAQNPDWQVIESSVDFWAGEDSFDNMIRMVNLGEDIPEICLYDTFSGDSTSYYWLSLPAGSHQFNVLQDGDGSITAEINNNFQFNTDVRWETGNINPEDDPNFGYAIFRIDAPTASVDSPITLNFDVEQLGRYGLDKGRIAYAPDGTFSTDVFDLQRDDQNLLIDALVAQEKLTPVSIDFFSNMGEYDTDGIYSVYIDDTSYGTLYFNVGTSSKPNWMDFFDYKDIYQDREDGYLYVQRAEIESGMLAYSGRSIEIEAYFYASQEDEEEDNYYNDYDSVGGVLTTVTRDFFSNRGEYSTDEIYAVYISETEYGELLYNLGTNVAPEWISFWAYKDAYREETDEYLYVPVTEIDAGKLAYIGDHDFNIYAYFYANAEAVAEDDYYDSWTSDAPIVVEPVETVTQAGSVTLEGDGYIWVRYANMFHTNEGADQAWIKSLYVDNGATLQIVGQKALSDGIANTQTIAGNTELLLNGVAVDYIMPDHSAIEGELLMYMSSPDIEKFDGLDYEYIGKNQQGELVEDDDDLSSFYGTDRPNDGMYRFLPMDDMDVSVFERFTWEEETSSPQLWEPNFGLVKGSLNNLADQVRLSNLGDELFSISYSIKEYRPHAPIGLGEDSIFVPTEEVVPYFASSIMEYTDLAASASEMLVDFEGEQAVRVILTSADNLANRSIIITGTDADGAELTETISGPNANTVATEAKFLTVSSVSISEGSAVGNLSVGHALTFDLPRSLAAYSSDGMPTTEFTMIGLDAEGQFQSITLNGTQTGVTHPLGVFSEVWSVTNNGRASETLNIIEINAPQTVLNVGQYGENLLNIFSTNISVNEGSGQYLHSNEHYSYRGLSEPSQLVISASPELAGRVVQFYGYSPNNGYTDWYYMTIPESGVITTDLPFEWAENFYVQEGVGAGNVSLSWASPVPDTSDLVLIASTDFAGSFTLTGVDAEGGLLTRTVSSLDANTPIQLEGFIAIIGYEYDGEGSAPQLDVIAIPRKEFFQEIPLLGDRDEQGYIAFAGERNVVITVKQSDAENQIIKVTGLVNGELITETLYGIADSNTSAITKNAFTHLLNVQVGADNNDKNQQFSIGTVTPVIDEQKVSRYGGDVKLGEAVAVLESASKVTLTSSDDLSASSFVIKGLNASGAEITETLTGPNAATIMSTQAFSKVTSIVAQGSAQGDIKVGYVTQAGAMVDDFVIMGDGTASNPYSGYSTNTLEAYLAQGQDTNGAYSEADILLYVDTRNAQGAVNLHYDLAMQGSSGGDDDEPADRLFIEFSAKQTALLSGEVTFEDGKTETTIYIPIAGDDTRESNEGMILTLTSSSTGTTIVPDERTTDITIANDDDVVSISAVAQSGKEGNTEDGKVSFVLNRLDAGSAKTVRWEVVLDDTTTAQENDFVSLTGIATFAAGQTTAVLDVILAKDRLLESDEAFKVKLSTPLSGSGYQIVGNDLAVGTIINDDSGIRISAVNAEALEGDAGTVTRTYTVTRTGDLSSAANVTWQVNPDSLDASALGATAGDFVGGLLTNQSFVFAADANSTSQSTQTQTITLNTTTDNFLSGDRGFKLSFANGQGDNTDLSHASILDAIREDDPLDITVTPPTDRAESNEGNKAFTFTLTRNDNTTQPLTVNWKVLLEGTGALANLADFSEAQDALENNDGLPSGTATFAAGSATTTVTVMIKGDLIIEASEAFRLDIKPAYSSVAGVQHDTKIIGDDVGYNVIIDTLQMVEGNVDTLIKLHFVRSGDLAAADLSYHIRGLSSVLVDATNSDDFTSALTGNLAFAQGQEQFTIEVMLKGDALYESDEAFVVDFKNGDALLATSSSVTIANDDARVSINVDKASYYEGNSLEDYETLTYTLTREGNTNQVSTMNWAVQAATGLSVADFVDPVDGLGTNAGLPSGTVTFDTGETTKTLTLLVSRDSLFEVDEVIRLLLSNASAGTSFGGDGSASTSVINDDAQVYLAEITGDHSRFSEADPQSAELLYPDPHTDYIEKTYLVKREGNIDITSTVQWIIEGVGEQAVDSYDFLGLLSGSLTFNASETEKTVTVKVASDRFVEADETFQIRLHSPSEGTSIKSGAGTAQTVTIENDDIGLRLDPTSAIRVVRGEGQESVTEFTWTIKRIGYLDEAVTLNYRVSGNDWPHIYDANLADYARDSDYYWDGHLPHADQSDFESMSGTVIFAEGDDTATLTVRVLGDKTVETSEAFKVYVDRPANALDFKLNDVDGNYAFTQALEGIIARDEASLGITSELDAATLAAARAMIDAAYIAAAGEDGGEPNEALTYIEASTAKPEGDTTDYTSHFFKVYREFSTSGDVSVDWKVEPSAYWMTDVYPYLTHNITAEASVNDFVTADQLATNNGFPSGRITIPDGEAYVVLEVRTRADVTAEDIESFKVTLSNVTPGNSINGYANHAVGYIGNDDALFSVGKVAPDTDIIAEMGSKVVDEAAGTVTYRIYRSGDLSHAAAVDWAVSFPEVVTGGLSSNNYLASAADFDTTSHPLSGTVSFAENETYRDVTLKIANDTTTESWAEFFSIGLTNARYTDGYTGKTAYISSVAGSMESMIIDNDTVGSMVSVSSVVNNNGFEGTPDATTGTTITYTLTRSGADTASTAQIAWVLEVPASAQYPDVTSIVGNTGAYKYQEGYWSGLVTFAGGETSKTITVNVLADQYLEQDEAFKFTLVDAKSILDNTSDDIKYTAWWYNYGADGSSAGAIDHGIYLGDTESFESVAGDGNVPDSGNMIRNPNDYEDIAVVRNDDIRLHVSSSINGSPAVVVYEGNTGKTDVSFDLIRYGRIDSAITLGYELIAGTATDGTDFVISSGPLSLAAGTADTGNDSKTYTFTLEDVINGDRDLESSENFTIRLTSPSSNVYFSQTSSNGGSSSVDITTTIKTDDTTWWVDVDNNVGNGIQDTFDAVEANSGNTPFVFHIHRTNDWGGNNHYNGIATVNWSLALDNGSTFASAIDFVETSGVVTFAENEFVKAVTVYVKGDALPEWTESFGFKIDTVSHGVIDSEHNLITAKILNDDTAISIDDVSVVEGDDGTTTMTYTINRKGNLEKESSVSYLITNGTASDSDVQGDRSGSIYFETGTNTSERYGEDTKTITIMVNGDTTPENHETLDIALSGVSVGTTLLKSSAVGTILNDEATFTLTASEHVNEGNATGQLFTVTRSHATTQEQIINWTVSSAGNGPRAALSDDILGGFSTGSLTFAANSNELTKTFFVKTVQDSTSELNEIFKVMISAGDGLVADDIAQNTAYGAILNDDTATAYTGASDSSVSLAGPASVVEGNDGIQYVVFTLNRTFTNVPYDGQVSWSLSFADGQTATAADFDATSGTLLLPAGQTSIELRIPVKGDSTFESDETFTANLISLTAGMAIGTATAIGTIINDDALIAISDNVVVNEGAGTATFTLVRTGALTSSSSVSWTLSASANVAGTDDIMSASSGTAVFAANSDKTTVTIQIRNDAISEANEVFNFSISNPSIGASLDPSHLSKTLTLTNDDLDRISYEVDAVSKPEGDGIGWTSYYITVNRENPTESMQVNWTVEDISPETLAAIEFEAANGQVLFEAGSLTGEMVVRVKSDDIGDFNKLFNLTLTPVDATKAFVATDDAEIQVVNDDPAFAVALSTDKYVEGSGTNAGLITFTIARTGDTTGSASVRWSLATDEDHPNPANLSDFGGYWSTGIAHFVDGETIKTIQIAIAPDNNFEADEGFKVILSDLIANDPGARITKDEDQAVIANDDVGVSVHVDQSSVIEGNDANTALNFAVKAEGVPNKTVTIHFTLEGSGSFPVDQEDFSFVAFNGTRIGSNFNSETNSGWVTLRTNINGYAQTDITVNILGDRIAGTDETLRMRVTDVQGGTVAKGMAEVTIINDDVAIASIANTTENTTEGNSGNRTFTFMLTRTGDVSNAATVDYVVEGFGDNPADAADFGGQMPSGVATFAAGSATATITVNVSGDTAFESNEGFIVIVGKDTPNEVRLATEIQNDDSATLEFRGIVTTVYEGEANNAGVLSYEIVRNGDNSEALTVTYAITGVDAANFVGGLTGEAIIPAGESRVVLNIPVVGNALSGSDRNFTVSISADGFEQPASVSSSIIDDDSGVTLELIGNGELTEGNESIYTFRINRFGNDFVATTFAWTLMGIGLNAASESDFVNEQISGEVAFTGNDATLASKTFTVTVNNDAVVENTEAFRVTLAYAQGAANTSMPIRVASADAYIVDNDSATANSDVIHGGAGADVINALAGNDTIYGGAGADVIYGGEGDDVIHGEGGADAIYGGAGDDLIVLDADNVEHFAVVDEDDATTFVDGGLGVDTLALALIGGEFDLGRLLGSSIKGIDRVEITSKYPNNILAVDIEALLTQDVNVFDTGIDGIFHQLMIDGDSGNAVEIAGFNESGVWVRSDENLSYDNQSYAVFTHATTQVQLLISSLMIDQQPAS